ncbi:X-ray radiation resistance-associated protein 1 [Taenia solium]|eukprot:TsM_000415600 transcript=TsM_000415600 gene=TsM_000415600
MINVKLDERHLKSNAGIESNRYAPKLIRRSQRIPEVSSNSDGIESNLNSGDDNSKHLCGNNKKLDLSYNFLPPSALVDLGELQCLRSLILVGNELSSIPAKLRQVKFRTLEDLNLDDNKLHAAADIANLAQLPNLRRLSLANNEFASFPILRVETKPPVSKSKCPVTTKPQAQHKGTEFEIVFDDILTHKGFERLVSAYIPKRQSLHCSRKSTLQKTSLRQISPHRNLFKQSTKTLTKINSSNPLLIFPKLIYLDMGENMLTVEEAIIPVVVCPNLKILSIHGNPFIEEFSKSPPKIQTILVEQHGISIECERSKFWCPKCSKFGLAKSDQQRRDQLPPLTATVKEVDDEFEEQSTVDISKAIDSVEYPLFSQHQLSIEYKQLPAGIQKCLREFKSLDISLKDSEISNIEDNNASPTRESNLEPEWTRCVGDKDEDEGVESEVKIDNPFLYEVSELSNSDSALCDDQETLQIQQRSSGRWQNSVFLKEADNSGSLTQVCFRAYRNKCVPVKPRYYSAVALDKTEWKTQDVTEGHSSFLFQIHWP